jgi:hypothetical protein
MTEKRTMRTIHRDSNLELFRCITMLLIVAHHYVVNSGLLAMDGPVWENPCSWKSLFLLSFGAFGKTGINCFVLITGYYMCKSEITARKYFRLLGEIYFYKIVINCLFILFGKRVITQKLILVIILPFWDVNRDFVVCFILFYLFIPFLTILVRNLTAKQHVYLTILSLLIYTIVEPIPWTIVPMHYVSWFIVLFLIASFIRLHMEEYMKKENNKWTIGWGIFLIFISLLSIMMVAWLSKHVTLNSHWEYYFVGESNRPLPVITGILAFVVFKKMRLPYISVINIMGASTFGVLLIHANSDTMRQWLWRDFLHNVDMYDSPWLVVHAVGCVLAIFIVGIAIDRLRIRFIEPPLMVCFDKLWPSVVRRYSCFENWFAKKTHCFIGE